MTCMAPNVVENITKQAHKSSSLTIRYILVLSGIRNNDDNKSIYAIKINDHATAYPNISVIH